MEEIMRRHFIPKEVAEICGVPTRIVLHWMESCSLHAHIIPGEASEQVQTVTMQELVLFLSNAKKPIQKASRPSKIKKKQKIPPITRKDKPKHHH